MSNDTLFNRKNKKSSEESDIFEAIKQTRESIDLVYKKIDFSSDDLIIDSLNYELLALKTRHKYLIEKAKEMNMTTYGR